MTQPHLRRRPHSARNNRYEVLDGLLSFERSGTTERVSPRLLATSIGLPEFTVARISSTLAREELIDRSRKGIRLSGKGRAQALALELRAETTAAFLSLTLKLDAANAGEEGKRLAPHLTNKFVARMSEAVRRRTQLQTITEPKPSGSAAPEAS